jgi:hypothetical protein
MIKVDCLVAGVFLREIGAVLVILPLSWLAYNLCILSANGKQGLETEEVFQTLLTNKKHGKLMFFNSGLLVKGRLLSTKSVL